MKKDTVTGLLIAGFFGAVAFGATSFGLQNALAAGSAATLGSVVGLAVFFSLFSGLDRAGDRYDVSRRFQKLNLDTVGRRPRRSVTEEEVQGATDALQQLSSFARRFLRIGENDVPRLRQRLMAAGYQRDEAALYYVIVKAMMPFLAPVVIIAIFVARDWTSQFQLLLALGLGVVIGLFGLDYLLEDRIKKRRAQIMLELPDVLDIIVIYTESGMSFDAALPRAIEALRRRCPTATGELRMLEQELRILPERTRAFRNLALRCDTPLVKTMVAILEQSESMGTPISQALRTLGAEGRRMRMAAAEQRAARIPVLIQLPLVMFILPALLIVVLGPTALKIMNTFALFMR